MKLNSRIIHSKFQTQCIASKSVQSFMSSIIQKDRRMNLHYNTYFMETWYYPSLMENIVYKRHVLLNTSIFSILKIQYRSKEAEQLYLKEVFFTVLIIVLFSFCYLFTLMNHIRTRNNIFLCQIDTGVVV